MQPESTITATLESEHTTEQPDVGEQAVALLAGKHAQLAVDTLVGVCQSEKAEDKDRVNAARVLLDLTAKGKARVVKPVYSTSVIPLDKDTQREMLRRAMRAQRAGA